RGVCAGRAGRSQRAGGCSGAGDDAGTHRAQGRSQRTMSLRFGEEVQALSRSDSIRLLTLADSLAATGCAARGVFIPVFVAVKGPPNLKERIHGCRSWSFTCIASGARL